MLLLAFDTTSENGGAGIYRDHECLASTTNQGPANFYSVTLFQMVEQLLRQANLTLRDLELFAVANGPGSFTGIRVGLAAAQGWANALNRPVKGISVLEAMLDQAQPKTECAIPVLDARRGEFYLGLFRRPPGQARFELEREAMVLKSSALGLFLEEFASAERRRMGITCVVQEHERLSETLRDRLPVYFRWQSVSGSLVGSIARLALQAWREGNLESPAQLDACYIRRSDAELSLERIQEPSKKAER